MKLIEHIVRNDRPFSEIITADYIMVTPFSARGYGVFEELKDTFKNPEDPLEYVPIPGTSTSAIITTVIANAGNASRRMTFTGMRSAT